MENKRLGCFKLFLFIKDTTGTTGWFDMSKSQNGTGTQRKQREWFLLLTLNSTRGLISSKKAVIFLWIILGMTVWSATPMHDTVKSFCKGNKGMRSGNVLNTRPFFVDVPGKGCKTGTSQTGCRPWLVESPLSTWAMPPWPLWMPSCQRSDRRMRWRCQKPPQEARLPVVTLII